MARLKRQITIRPREKRGTWELDYLDSYGKRRRPVFPTEERALARAAEVSKTLAQIIPVDVDDPYCTLRDYVARWLQNSAQEIDPKTLASYTQLLNLHVLPVLGSVKLCDLHRRHVKGLLATKRAERLERKRKSVGAQDSEDAHKHTVKGGYSKNTVRLVKAALSTVLSDAVDDGYLATNVAFSAGRKRGKRAEALTQAERLQKIRPFSWEERDALLTASAPDRRHHVLFSVQAKAGLRPGEAMALKPDDIDFKSLTVHVERSVSDKGRVKDTKTHEVRTVDLTPDLATTLKKHLTWLRAEALKNGSGEPRWMFPREDGSLMDKDYLGNVFRRTLKKAGLPHHRVYDLRHTFSCLLLSDGAPINYVSEQLGHSSAATTLRFYSKWIPKKGQRWVNVLDRKGSHNGPAVFGEDLEPESGASGGGV